MSNCFLPQIPEWSLSLTVSSSLCSSYPCQVKADGSHIKFWCGTDEVGRNISTKEVGSKERVDITDSYKHEEGELTC